MATHGLQHVIDQLVGLADQKLTFEQIRGDIECARNKPLLIELDAMPITMTGYVVALQDVDLICTRRGMHPLRTQFVVLHEMAHLLLGHIPRSLERAAACTYAQFTERRDISLATHRSYSGMDGSPAEQAAETLATALLNRNT